MSRKDVVAGMRNEEGIATVLGLLKQSFGERFQTGQSFREQHAHTTTYLLSAIARWGGFRRKRRGCEDSGADLRPA